MISNFKETTTMKKYKAYIKTLAALVMTGAAMTACSDKDLMANEDQQSVSPTNHYTMTVNATIGDNGTKNSNRALYLDGEALKVKWADTDKVSVFKAGTTTLLGTLTAAASETGTTTLSGDLTGTVNEGDKLHLIFPRADWTYADQSGVLLGDGNSIEKNYDYAMADVTVAAIDGSHITTTADANLASQQAIVKFILKDKATDNPINAKKLTVTAASNKLVTNKRVSDHNYYSGYKVDRGGGGISGDDYPHLVDGDPNTKWCADDTHLWYIDFHTDAPIQVDGYMFRTAGDTKKYPNRNPRSWELKGTLNKEDDEWTTIDSRSDNTDMPALNNTEHDFTATKPGTYQYFSLTINGVQDGNIMQLSEMKLFAKGAEATEITEYGPISATPDAAASELTVALRNENAGADTYTLTAYDGSLYTLEKEGITFENGKYYEITAKLAELTTIDLSTVTESEITVRNGNTITGTHDQELKIFIADGANVTLNNANITNGSIVCNGNAGINLVGTNTITAPANYAAVQIGNEGTTLTISGTGSLNATGGENGAGIGTGLAQDEEKTGGNITINGGTINATGGYYGAGIGCGQAHSNTESNDAANKCGNISITGGTVTATGGMIAAGIGTGAAVIGYENRFASNICGDISITGGTVTANGDVGGAGIGTGSITTIMGTGSAKCGNITIGNGVTKVTATKVSDSACSIGKAGNTTYYECGTITIGGTVYPDGISTNPYVYQP